VSRDEPCAGAAARRQALTGAGRVLGCLSCFPPPKEKRLQEKGDRLISPRWHFPN
jgi:hypothetical protein